MGYPGNPPIGGRIQPPPVTVHAYPGFVGASDGDLDDVGDDEGGGSVKGGVE